MGEDGKKSITRSRQAIAPACAIRLKFPSYSSPELRNARAQSPNEWFAAEFPTAANHFGAAFVEARYEDGDGFTRITPTFLNIDFFAAAVGGDIALGQQIIYFAPEETFYLWDNDQEAFVPIRPAKLELIPSNYLIRCAQDMPPPVDIENLVDKFRRKQSLQHIADRAKAVLDVDDQFFSRHKRFLRGKIIDPNAEPIYRAFVKQALKPKPEAMLTVSDCFTQYDEFCRAQGLNTLERSEFKKLVAEVIRKEFGAKLRHDIRNGNGRQNDGWKGIAIVNAMSDREHVIAFSRAALA